MDAWLRRRLAWAALVVAAVGAALLVLPPASLARVVVDDVSTTTAAGFAAFLAFRRSRTSRDAQAWLFLGLGLALVAAGEAFWLLSDLVLQQRVASLSLADSLYYGGYAALLVAVACWFPRLGGPSAWLRRLLDFAIVVTSLSMMAWVTVGAGLVERYPGETFGAVVAISYPLLDLALAATFIILALEVPSGTRGPMMVVGLGIGIWAAADLSYAFLAAEGAYASGLPLATAWVAGYLLVAAGAAWHPSPPPSQPAGARDRTAMAWLPYAFAAPALAVAITRYATFADLGAVEEMLLLLLVFAILLRQFLFIEDQTAVGRELRASEAGLADAQAISHVGSWEWDTVRNLATMSAEGLRVWGLPPDSGALPLQRFIDLVHPEDRAILEGATNEAVASGTGYDVTVRAQSPVGMRNTRHRGQVSRRDASGRPTILRGTIEDITDRVVAERALRRSEERFRMAARATQDVLWEWDAATNTSYHSEQIASYGLDPAAVATMEGFSALIHPDDLKGFGRAIDDLLTGSEDHLSAEYRFRRADGTYADILDKALILRDEAGHPVRLVGAMQDISERKRADRELMARQALLAETQAVGHVGSWEIDLLTGKQRSSDENQRLYGLGLDEEVTPESVGRNIYPEDAPRILELLGRIPRTGSEEIECRVVRPDGSLRWLYTKGVARYDDAGRPVRITGFTQDITERKRAEQELQARDSRFEEVQAIARVGSWEWVAATDRVTLTEQASRNWG
ncbi:MAG: hypothetical protein QOC71_354, partial [Thermoplasmata archaeon]|nr:hypothetical protein [Thermoplasmata archaeon]